MGPAGRRRQSSRSGRACSAARRSRNHLPTDTRCCLTSHGGVTALAASSQPRCTTTRKRISRPICMLGEVSPVMVVPAALQVQSVQELIALAKQKPGQLNYGSFGNGSYSACRHGGLQADEPERRSSMFRTRERRRPTPPSAAQRGVGDDRQPRQRGRICSGRRRQDHCGGRLPPRQGPARSADRRRVRRAGILHQRLVGVFGPANLPPVLANKISAEIYRILARPSCKRSTRPTRWTLWRRHRSKWRNSCARMSTNGGDR